MPFKDKVKQLNFMRNYQETNRQKLKDLKETHELEVEAIDIMRKHSVGRYFYNVVCLTNEDEVAKVAGVLKCPIINIDFDSAQLLENSALKIVEEEDKLLLVGEYEGWTALGIQGLATAKGRNIVISSGNVNDDLQSAVEQLKRSKQHPPYDVIVNSKIKQKYYIHGNEIRNIYSSPFLVNSNGKPTNILVVKPSARNFRLLIAQDMVITKVNNNHYKLWEALVPVIDNSKAICEIQGLTN
jgi:hypothetical protein